MKPFVFDSAVVDPMDGARRDYMEYFVDKILQHRNKPKKSSSMKFEVSWLNYPPDSSIRVYGSVVPYMYTWRKII